MIPFYDNISPRSFPFINFSVIAICTVVYALQDICDACGISLVERSSTHPIHLRRF